MGGERDEDGELPGPDATRRGARPDPLVGRLINDRFLVTGLLARGGMGKVYRAEQAPLGREVALKVLNPNYRGDGDPEFHRRFFLEASTCAKLTHPNTVTIFDYGRTDDDIYYIAMELLEGDTLHRTLRREGPFDVERAMHITRQICRSLREAHGIGVIHRDLKPANIFLVSSEDEEDFVKVLDFGLVKDLEGSGEDLTQTGLFMGSPKYMSPEQIQGDEVDGRADLYSLGVILFEMLTGTVPFDRTHSVNILMAHVHDEPPSMQETNPDVSVPEGLAAIVACTLAKSPDDRFASMDALLDALRRLLYDAGLPVTVSAELSSSMTGITAPTGAQMLPSGSGSSDGWTIASAPPPPRSATARRGPWVMAVVGVLALLAAGLVALFAGTREAPIPTPAPNALEAPAPEPAPEVPIEVAPAMPSPIRVAITSSPPGALVRVGGREYGPTPVELEWGPDDAEPGDSVEFVFSLRGHQPYAVSRVMSGESVSVNASLNRVRTAPRSGGRAARRPPRDRPTQEVRGYKLDPY
ncbi:MAG: serine/threonine protein kinase [Sandaracinaceae bacterium]